LVAVEVEQLPTVSTIDEALAENAPILYDGWRDCRVTYQEAPADPRVDAAFESLDIVGDVYTIQRQAPMPMETRGVLAEFEDGRVTVWSSTQISHMLRTILAEVLGLRESNIRVIAPDVGGGFGGKAQIYPEELLIPWLAMRLGRPVRWVEDRNEHMLGSCHGRDMRISLEAAVCPHYDRKK
jgi:carbon-monoxide dehydrogenase large subunit